MRRAICTAVAFGVLVMGVTAAGAHTKVFSTTLQVTGWGSSLDSEFHFHARGYLEAWNGKCLSWRTVRLFFTAGETRTLVDVDVSSLHGAWAVRGEADAKPDSFTIRLARKRIDRQLGTSHDHVCSGDTVTTVIP